MKVNKTFEIVGFYPLYGTPGKKLVMSAHVYFPEEKWDIRGWLVHFNNYEDSKVYPPMGKSFDYEEKKTIDFPILESSDKGQMDEIKLELIKQGKEFFKTFKYPANFPKNFNEYEQLMRPKSKNFKPNPRFGKKPFAGKSNHRYPPNNVRTLVKKDNFKKI